MEYTQNMRFQLPELQESADIDAINQNFQAIDQVLTEQSHTVNTIESSTKSTFALHHITLGMTRKNILRNKATSKIVNGIDFTVNPDGSVIAKGTATAATYLVLNSAVKIPYSQRYILTGCPEGGGASKYQLYLSGDTSAYDRGSGAEVYLATTNAVSAYIMIASGQTVDLTFYPMLRPAEITDATFEAYKPSIDERLAALEAAQPALAMEVTE